MDHKVSKDMISSGMIPSGEKTQADLSRTQYGSAPSPSKLMDAYKSMYEKKEEVINEMAGVSKIIKGGRSVRSLGAKKPEGSFLSRQKEKLAAQTGKKPTKPPYTAGQTPTETRTRADKDRSTYAYKPEKAGLEGDFKIAKKPETTYTPTPESEIKARRARVKEMESQGKVRQTSYEKVDLLAAYRAVYEHHKKDADGNTIPHEGEEINEALPLLAAPLIAKGLMALKGTKAVAAAVKGAAAFKKGLTTAKAVGAAGKITTTGGKLASGTKKVGMMQKAGSGLRSAGASIKNNPVNTALVGSMAIPQGRGSAPQPAGAVQQTQLGRRTAGMYNDVDLFDIVKGQLLDEGLNEKEITDVMTTLTLEEINEVIQLNEVSASLLKRASISAGNKAMQLASKKDSAGAVKKLEQQKKFSGAMKQKNLATSRVDNMRKPTGPMANRPIPDYSKPYPGTPR